MSANRVRRDKAVVPDETEFEIFLDRVPSFKRFLSRFMTR
jgi:hypothetical protein